VVDTNSVAKTQDTGDSSNIININNLLLSKAMVDRDIVVVEEEEVVVMLTKGTSHSSMLDKEVTNRHTLLKVINMEHRAIIMEEVEEEAMVSKCKEVDPLSKE